MVPANFEPDSKSVLSRKPYVPMVFLTYLCQASRELKFCGRFDVWVDCLDDVVVVDVVLLFVFVVFVIVGVVFDEDEVFDFDDGECFAMYPFAVSISWNRGTSSRHIGGSCERSSMARLMGTMIDPNPCLYL